MPSLIWTSLGQLFLSSKDKIFYWLAGDYSDNSQGKLHKTHPQLLIWNKTILYLKVIILKQENHTLLVVPVCFPEEVCFSMCLLTSFTASKFLFFFKISMTYLDRASGTLGLTPKFRSMTTSSVCPKATNKKIRGRIIHIVQECSVFLPIFNYLAQFLA